MPKLRRSLLVGLVPVAVCLAAACRFTSSAPEKARAPGAQPSVVEALRAEDEAVRHPSDGGGRAWIEGSRQATAGASGRWVIVYEAGPLGIALDGQVFLQVPPFWGWSTPQVDQPEALGYTKVTTAAKGIELKAETLDQGLLAVRIGGRALAQGERVRFEYGAGRAGARADHFAEHDSPFWVAVDGDGDGYRRLVANPPTVDVGPGAPALLVVTWPTTARPGESIRLTLAVLDARGNAGIPFEGSVSLQSEPPDRGIDRSIHLKPADAGHTTLALALASPGVRRITAETASGLRGTSGPLVVSADVPRVLWADIHGHSALSDGTGTPQDYYQYARDVAGLDVAALTDHDHWGLEPLARTPRLWEAIRTQVRAFHEPGRFVTLLGFEWTSWLHGHRHVLYFGDEGQVIDSLDPAFETPAALWAALKGKRAITVAHHSAGGPIGTNWAFAPDPELEPVTEIASVHGASEALDAPRLIYSVAPGNTVRDALNRGYRLGFVGGGDGHDGHPGLTALGSPSGGLAAILSDENTREAILQALRARRVYATNGPRIHLQATLDGLPMGAEIRKPSGPTLLAVRAVTVESIRRLDVIRSGRVVESVSGEGRSDLLLDRRIEKLRRGEYLYVRVVQEDDGAAWSSPFFIR